MDVSAKVNLQIAQRFGIVTTHYLAVVVDLDAYVVSANSRIAMEIEVWGEHSRVLKQVQEPIKD